MIKRFSIAAITAIFVSGFYTLVFASASPSAINMVPMLTNIESDAIIAREKNIPVIFEFSMVNCPFCYQVEDEVLRPMLISGDYDNRVIIRKVLLDGEDEKVIDFNGKPVTIEELASRYSVDVVPTLVILDGYGRPLGKPMRGVTTIDYYGQYLDIAIDQALSQLKSARLKQG